MNVTKIWEDKKQLKVVTGLTLDEANEIIHDFSSAIGEIDLRYETPEGRPRKLTHRELFILVMMFFRHYPTYDLLAVLFELNSSNVKRWVDRCSEALQEVLAKKNFSHLLARQTTPKSAPSSTIERKSILTALSNLSADRSIP